jgi:acyl-CoA reductase-like NAD-dependent aldehyde dehydrogenase
MAGTLRPETRLDEHFIDGRWQTPTAGRRIDIVSPSTEEVIGSATLAGIEDVDKALRAARTAFDEGSWSARTPAERGRYVAAIADAFESRLDESTQALVAEMGRPITASRRGNAYAVAMARDFAEQSTRLCLEEAREVAGGTAHIIREPVGVVLAIVPWNGPLPLAINKLAPALIAGCTVVVKPAPETPYNSAIFAEAVAEAGLPPGVVNVVLADTDVAQHMVRSPLVDKISFTGSLTVGQEIIRASAQRLVRVTLELGGKSAAVVLDDADFDTLIPQLVNGSLNSSGQSCRALTRYLVPERRRREFVDALAACVVAVPVGDPFDETTVVGPMVSARHRERVESYLDLGRSEGARVVVGGGRPAGLARGWYVEPTVFDVDDPNAGIAQEEIFGPVITVLGHRGDDDAVRIANNSHYGLSGAVFTQDLDRGASIARRVRTGTMNVAKMGISMLQPFGGYKCSGLGREGGPEGFASYVEIKQMFVPR